MGSQDSLGGTTKTCLIATIGPTADTLEETLCTLGTAADVDAVVALAVSCAVAFAVPGRIAGCSRYIRLLLQLLVLVLLLLVLWLLGAGRAAFHLRG